MEKIVRWTLPIAFALCLISLGGIGVKLATGDYDFLPWAYVLAGCWAVIFACLMYRALTDKCPHCGKSRWTGGKFCSYCGKAIEK